MDRILSPSCPGRAEGASPGYPRLPSRRFNKQGVDARMRGHDEGRRGAATRKPLLSKLSFPVMPRDAERIMSTPMPLYSMYSNVLIVLMAGTRLTLLRHARAAPKARVPGIHAFL